MEDKIINYSDLTDDQLDTLLKKAQEESLKETAAGRIEGVRWTTLFNIKQKIAKEIAIRAKNRESSIITELLGL